MNGYGPRQSKNAETERLDSISHPRQAVPNAVSPVLSRLGGVAIATQPFRNRQRIPPGGELHMMHSETYLGIS